MHANLEHGDIELNKTNGFVHSTDNSSAKIVSSLDVPFKNDSTTHDKDLICGKMKILCEKFDLTENRT